MNLVYKNEKVLFGIVAAISLLFWLVLIVGTIGIALVYILFGYLFFLFAHSAFISYLKGTGVKITAEQFPDLHERLVKASRTLGLTELPDAYVLRTDFFNALATKFRGRHFLVLFSDVIDAFEERPDALDFYIGHELGHIHRKHLSWAAFLFPGSIFPIIGSALRRVEEYTCDRYGAACCNNVDDVKYALVAIGAGNSRWKHVNVEAYTQQVSETSGFWMSLNELTSDYPWLTKRVAEAVAFKNQATFEHPRRHFFAWFLSLFVPRLGVSGGGGGLLSLMVVVAIIGILAAVALPQYQNYVNRAANQSAYEEATRVQHKVDAYVEQNGDFPASLTDLGYSQDILINAKPFYEISLFEEGVIGAKVGETPAGDEKYIVLKPHLDNGFTSWQCYGQEIPAPQLPPACQ